MLQSHLSQLATDWQDTVDLMAQIVDVPAGLIMRLHQGHLEVFVSSDTQNNPYRVGDRELMEGSGLYCETVIKSEQELLVPNALKDTDWDSNPDIDLNMIFYLGYPIKWPDGSPFGTICVLDTHERELLPQHTKLVQKFQSFVERYLEIVIQARQLQRLAETDSLTNILNRRTFYEAAENAFDRAKHHPSDLHLLLLDIDNFKTINDRYGHQAGDHLLVQFTSTVSELLPQKALFGRYGGDEFIIMLEGVGVEEVNELVDNICQTVSNKSYTFGSKQFRLTTSIGLSNFAPLDRTLDTVVSRADIALYKAKISGKNCAHQALQ